MTLQLPRRTAAVSPLRWWALTPPSHPYLLVSRRLFSSTLLCPRGRLPVKKWNALCCPDFPPASRRCTRQADQLFLALTPPLMEGEFLIVAAKLMLYLQITKCYKSFTFVLPVCRNEALAASSTSYCGLNCSL